MYTESVQVKFLVQVLVEIHIFDLLDEPQKLSTSLGADLI